MTLTWSKILWISYLMKQPYSATHTRYVTQHKTTFINPTILLNGLFMSPVCILLCRLYLSCYDAQGQINDFMISMATLKAHLYSVCAAKGKQKKP